MQQRNGARELGLIVAALGVLVHFVDPAPAAVATALIATAAAAGMGNLLGEARPWRMPLIPLVLPALAAFSIVGIARLVDPVPWLGVIFVAAWAAVTWIVRLEAVPVAAGADVRPAAPRPGWAATPTFRLRPTRRVEFDLPQIVAEPIETGPELPAHPRPVAVRATSLGLAFVAFAAIGGIVPGGLAGEGGPLSLSALAATVTLDVVVGGLVGYRIASIACTSRFDRIVRLLAVGQYAVPVGIAGALLRLLALPRLFGPALLTLVVYVVTVVRESPEPVLYNRRLLQEAAVLGLAGALAVVWGLAVR
ncbi:MAG: hypothetical protein ABSE70_03325 [Candidatus Limnocylindrales bacterium]